MGELDQHILLLLGQWWGINFCQCCCTD